MQDSIQIGPFLFSRNGNGVTFMTPQGPYPITAEDAYSLLVWLHDEQARAAHTAQPGGGGQGMSYQQYRDKINREYDAYVQLEGRGEHARFHYQRAWLGQVLFRCGSNPEEAVQSVQKLLNETRDKEKKAYLEAQLHELQASLK